MATTPQLRGVVTEFSDDAGLGEVTTGDGQRHPFHCTSIADGSRTVPVGTDVTFAVVAGHAGTWEAVGLLRS